jgi:hypothetical protein
MDAAGVPVFQELLVEDAVFAEVPPEIQEDAFAAIFKVDLISTDAIGSIVNCERCRSFSLLSPDGEQQREPI